MLRWTLLSLVLLVPAAASAQPKELDADHAAKMAKGLDLFKKKVKPILTSKCLRCHGGKTVENEFDIADRDTFLKGGLHGVAVVPGKARESILVKLIRHDRDPHMPEGSAKLPDESIALISEWIDLGAPYDGPLTDKRAKALSWTEKVLPTNAKKFWSFEPLVKAVPPTVKNESWIKTPLDRFILAKQEAAGIGPNPPVERRLLIRRVAFSLTGLPPTPEEVEAFVNDKAPDAYAKVIDRLLASPHYGERWARHWLDLARFAESHGFEHDYDRPSAYHYRDFVIEALNQDLPYDKFVQWQIAGDELDPDNPLAWKATGFLAAGVHSTQITKSEVEKHRYDELDDKLNTLSTAFLGLSVGCARCHDHKYDPIPQRDYYRMLSTFTATVRSEVDLTIDSERYGKAKAAFDEAHQPRAEALKAYEAKELPGKLAEWEKSAKTATFGWEILEPTLMESKEGATLTLQADGSILATGTNGKFDVYTLEAAIHGDKLRFMRVEALAHPSMVKGGPGRAANGNFALSDVQVQLAGPDPKAAPVMLKLKNPRATFEQKGLPVAATIDADLKSAWAVDPQLGKDHAAVYEIDPLTVAPGSRLIVTLRFNNNDGHNLGRPRLSASGSDTAPGLLDPGMPARARLALSTPAAKRTPEQTAALLAWFRHQDAGWKALNQKVEAHLATAPRPTTVKALVATEGRAAVRLHTQGEDLLPFTHFLRRGDVDMKEGVASPSYLQVLMPSADAAKRWEAAPPSGAKQTYRRTALARWLTDTESGAGNLLARVIVNRLWQHHLGKGLVATPSDFGARGERPTHPELLDYLAAELISSGWNLKHIHRLILTSAVFQQGSQFDESRAKVDRENALWWRKPARRLEAEVIRDTLLAVSGELDRTMFGPGTLKEESKRRSIYFTVKRSKLMPMMVIFDAPEALSGMAERPTTTIAPQALAMMNNPQVRAWARSFARRVAPDAKTSLEDAVRNAHLIALARPPLAQELTDAVAFLNEQMRIYSGATARENALTDFCQVMMCLNEMVYVD
jgi:hypothetical protein